MRCFVIALGVLLLWTPFGPARAQAVRTWVSGAGNDANPCDRTAPCQTFAAAISKTIAAGEINCVDSAGFGSLTITKAIRIACGHNTGGVLAAPNVDGIVINAGPNDVIHLSGLDINGAAGGRHGINFINAARLIIDGSTIRNFAGAGSCGVLFGPDLNGQLQVENTAIVNNGSASDGGGIRVAPQGSTITKTSIVSSLIERNRVGVSVVGNGSTTSANVFQTRIVHNTSTGVAATGGLSDVRIGSSHIADNGGPATVGNVLSYGNNEIAGNTPDTSPTHTALR